MEVGELRERISSDLYTWGLLKIAGMMLPILLPFETTSATRGSAQFPSAEYCVRSLHRSWFRLWRLPVHGDIDAWPRMRSAPAALRELMRYVSCI